MLNTDYFQYFSVGIFSGTKIYFSIHFACFSCTAKAQKKIIQHKKCIRFSEVTLTQNIDKYNLQAGDLATLIDFVPHPQGKEDGCILEVFNAVGESIAVITVPKSAIQPLQANQVLTTRSF